MSQPRLLIYSDAPESAPTLQIRLVAPLGLCGLQIVNANQYGDRIAAIPRAVERDFEAVVVHRAILKRCRIYDALLAAARRCGKPVIHDTDDLLFRVCTNHPDYPVYRAKAIYALKALVDADGVVASTPVLADHLATFHSRVVVIPNRLPTALWQDVCRRKMDANDHRPSEALTIGYIGSNTHQPDLELVEDALIAVLRRHRGAVRFLSVGVPLTAKLRSHPHAEERIPPKRISKSYPDFVPYAATLPIDVGIAPLVDNPFNQCKSDIKFQEYAALGIPAICSDLAPYRARVREGVNGCLAADRYQWENRLDRLVTSAEMRKSIRAEAMRELLESWQAPTEAVKWNEVLQQAKRWARCREARLRRDRIAPVIDEILSYQISVERRLKRTVEYQVGRTVGRLIRKLAG